MTDLCKHELSKHICIRCCRTERDALAAELAQWKNDNLEIAGKFTKANYRIRDLEAALRDTLSGNYPTPARYDEIRALVAAAETKGEST